MNPQLTSLLAASTAFVGTHFIMSHPLRAGMVRALGEKGFLGLYTLVSLGTFAWMVVAFRASPAGTGEVSEGAWVAASVLTIVALVLFLGSLLGNPALPDTPKEKVATAKAHGVFLVTRHPMMWGFALWALAHILLGWSERTLILAGSLLILALVGAHLQDRKKEALLGDAWAHWEAQTSYWPRWQRLGAAGPVVWIASLVIWAAATWAHKWLAGIPAGVWLWLG